MKFKVFVDGQEGTTGLEIYERLAQRSDVDVLQIDPEKRKDTEARRALLNEADVAFLCLPDAAAKESAALVESSTTRVIDASTAHRVDPDWTYGLPEISPRQRESIASSHRVANPGCHATASILALYPLVQEGILPADYPVSCCSITGYSGGGKKLIQKYQNPNPEDTTLLSPKPYALGLNHKHLPEIQTVSGLALTPIFTPIVCSYYRGMAVSIPLVPHLLNKKMDAKEIHSFFASYYASEHFVQVIPFDSEAYLDGGFFNVEGCNGTNRADLFVFGHDDQILIITRIDNLGKGASGAAIQNMNIMLGLDEAVGLSR